MKDYCVATTLEGAPYKLSQEETDANVIKIKQIYRKMVEELGSHPASEVTVRFNSIRVVIKTHGGIFRYYSKSLANVLQVEYLDVSYKLGKKMI
jgi:hypothetical protein